MWFVGAFSLVAGVVVVVRARNPTHVVVNSFASTSVNDTKPSEAAPLGMVWIPGGEFSMGCDDPREKTCGGPDAMPDARPVHRVYVDAFWMDTTEVTNAQFRAFVDATKYVTVAEHAPKPEDFPGVPSEALVPGSNVFTKPAGSVPLDDYSAWWRYEPGANWRHPEGPTSSLDGRDDYPVVHVAFDDAVAYASWAHKRLPTEAEWEFAARGGLTGELYVWGNDLRPGGKLVANTFQGDFPQDDTAEDGFAGIAPVARFAPNAYGLFDVAGNVWEWCSDWYRADTYDVLATHGVARNPLGPSSSFDASEPTAKKRVQRGGSFLCTSQYCTRYMVGSRGRGEITTGSNHVGFRCVMPRAAATR